MSRKSKAKKALGSSVQTALMSMALSEAGIDDPEDRDRQLAELVPAVAAQKALLEESEVEAVVSGVFQSESFVLRPVFEAGVDKDALRQSLVDWVDST